MIIHSGQCNDSHSHYNEPLVLELIWVTSYPWPLRGPKLKQQFIKWLTWIEICIFTQYILNCQHMDITTGEILLNGTTWATGGTWKGPRCLCPHLVLCPVPLGSCTDPSGLVYSFACLCAKSLQLCPTLCDPMDHSLPDTSVSGILQARTLEWVAMPSSRGSSRPRDRTCVSYVYLHW